jgi:hypothetical protein
VGALADGVELRDLFIDAGDDEVGALAIEDVGQGRLELWARAERDHVGAHDEREADRGIRGVTPDQLVFVFCGERADEIDGAGAAGAGDEDPGLFLRRHRGTLRR